jgi:hypothetical protein
VPDIFGDADAEVSDFEEDESSLEEQALRASSAAAPAPATCRVRRVRRAERVITVLLLWSLHERGS